MVAKSPDGSKMFKFTFSPWSWRGLSTFIWQTTNESEWSKTVLSTSWNSRSYNIFTYTPRYI